MKTKIMLVYQAGIANVFEVKCFNLASFGRDAKRLMQSDFRSCEVYCLGREDCGNIVRVAGCNQAGDIKDSLWTSNLEDLPFNKEFKFKESWNR